MTKQQKSFRAIILSLILANLFFAFDANIALAQAAQGPRDYSKSGVQNQIKEYLCTPSDASADPTAAQNDLYTCINKIYRFALVIASVLAVFFIVIAGWVYMASDGNEESVTKAKDILVTSIASLVILFGGYIFLRFLNPDLIKFQPIQPPSVVGSRGFGFDNLTDAQLAALFGAELNNKDTSKTIGKAYTGTKDFPAQGTTPLAIAQSQVGAKEDCCATNGEGLNKGMEINKYFMPGGTRGQPWCSYFTSWAFGQAGYTTIGSASVRGGSLSLSSFLQSKNNQTIRDGNKAYEIKYFTKTDLVEGKATPQPGDVAFFRRGRVGSGEGHSAIITSYDGATKNINTIDGNVDNSVSPRSRNIYLTCEKEGENGICDFIGFARVINK